MKKITWIKGGFNVPVTGKTEIGKTIKVEDRVAESLVAQGFAEYKTTKKAEPKEEPKKNDKKRGGNE